MFRVTTVRRIVTPQKHIIRYYARRPGTGPSDHTVNKPHELDIQSHSSKQGMREHDAESGRRVGDKVDPKKDHPKAPEPVIGMQDERGHTSKLLLFV
jgi:hypothetical protein